MTFHALLFKLAHGIFMKLFRKGKGMVSNGPAWGFMVWHVVAEMESQVASRGRSGRRHTHT